MSKTPRLDAARERAKQAAKDEANPNGMAHLVDALLNNEFSPLIAQELEQRLERDAARKSKKRAPAKKAARKGASGRRKSRSE